MSDITIPVNIPGANYKVIISPGLLERIGSIISEVAPSDKALLAVDKQITNTHGKLAQSSLRGAGFETTIIELVANEKYKTLETAQSVYQTMLAASLDRKSPVVALGGGIIGDTAGLAAATYMRGVPLIQVPTTLLAMVDAAIGGKTGVNFPLPTGGLGKNLIGAFWQPRAVLIDPLTLNSLSARNFRCGLGECVKYALIADANLLDFLSSNAQQILDLDPELITELIERCVRIKVRIVEQDEREAGLRALLNLGHTFAHAIESIHELDIAHGEAVSIGLVAAMKCAIETQRQSQQDLEKLTKVLKTLGLPICLENPVDEQRLLDAMRFDKKTSQGKLRLVLPCGPGQAEIVDDLPIEIILRAWDSVGAKAV
ncbi:MAG: 3-dehydroquinate synthase [Planctomycetes bacterium]|nr:3-dehydroquinate synthase [Planctomycetota bacterium]